MGDGTARAGAVALVVVVASTILAACTPPQPEADREPDRPTSSPDHTATAEPEETTEPLVLATRVDRPVVRMSADEAQELLDAGDAGDAEGSGAARGAEVTVLPASELDATLRPVVVDGVDPVRQPDAYPFRVQGPAPGPVVTLTLVGDVMLTRGVPDAARALAPMRRRLARADLTVGTLESTLSDDGAPQQGGDSFAADPEVVPLLARAGFDAVSVANNHVGDFEVPAMLETLRLLRAGEVRPFGAGRDLRAASRAVVLERGGVTFGFLGFNAIGETPRATPDQPGALSVRMPPRTGPLVESDLEHVEGLVRRLHDQVDVVVVLPHWGTQYTHVAEPIQHRVARRLARAGADLVVGGHPHWVQGLDRVRETVVAHSLGNFVFDMDFMVETQQGVVLETVWWGEELKSIDLVPYRMDADFAPRVVTGGEAADILADVFDHSRGPFSPESQR